MLPPRPVQNGSKNQPRTNSSKPTKNISKPRCEAWVPLKGWEQGDDAESDIYYLAIDAWAKRNSKIKTDAPKGVPSSKLWEPFLCTTVQQCSGILDFEAFVNVSLSLHKSIVFDEEEPLQNETTNLKKDLNQTSRTEGNLSTSNRTTKDQNKIKAEPLKKGDDQYGKKASDSSDKTTSGLSDHKINGHPNRNGNDHSNTKQTDNSEQHNQEEKKHSGYFQVPIVVLSDAEKFLQKDDCPGHLDIVNDSPPPLEGGGDGVELDNESILEWMARNGTSHSAPVSRTQQREPLKKRGRSAKTKSAEDILRRAALKNATKSKVDTKKVSVPANPVKISYMHSGNVRNGIPNSDLPGGEALDNVEVSVSESTPSESPTSETTRRTSLENRLLIEEVIKENSKKIEYMPKTTIVSIGDLLSSAPRLERRQVQQNNGRDSLYPSIANEDDGTSSRESFGSWTSPRPSEDLRSPSSSSLPPVPVTTKHNTPPREVHSSNSPRSDRLETVNLNPAKIPVISYRKGARRRDVEDNRDVAHNLEDTRHIKRLIKSALSRESSRVHSAGSIRQRGPPAFRPQSFKTPLQRAVENAHKKIYGNHYYLFNNSTATGMEHGDDERRTSTEVAMKGRRSQSAHGETTNAYLWKENIEAQQRQKRKSYSGTERIRARTTNGHGRDSGYKVSDFKPNFKVDTLKTDRKKTIQR